MRELRYKQFGWLDAVLVLCLCASAWGLSFFTYSQPREAAFDMKSPPGLLPAAGLYDIESFPDREGRYRWSNGMGVLKLPNLGGPIHLQILLAAGPEREIPVHVSNDDWALDFTVSSDLRSYQVLLPPSSSDRIGLHIDSPIYDEGDRQLGVLVSSMQITNTGNNPQIPRFILLAMWLASIGGFLLLRQSGIAWPWAVLAVLLVQVASTAWQNFEGWRYGLLGTAFLAIGGASLAAIVIERWIVKPVQLDDPPARLVLGWLDWLVLAAILLIAFLIRLPYITASDPVGDIDLSARQLHLLYYDGITGAYQFGNDYMPLRLFVLRLLGFLIPLTGPVLDKPLPMHTLIMLKLPGLLADAATIVLIYLTARRWRGVWLAAFFSALYAFSPPVWINVAWWGQVDAWLMLPMLACVLSLDYAKGRWSWLFWAIAILIKPQAIIIAPLLYIVSLQRYGTRGLVEGGVIAGALLLGCILPVALLQGGAGGIVQAYVGAVERFPLLTNKAYNLWYLVTWGGNGYDVGQGIGPLSYRTIGLLLTGLATALVMIVLLRRNDLATRLECAALLALAFFLLPTQIHERYLFLALAFLALRCVSAPSLLPLYLVFSLNATLNIIGTLSGFYTGFYYRAAKASWPLLVSGVNLALFVVLFAHLLWSLRRPISEPQALSPVRSQTPVLAE
jgi:Gpi18-like mannosyltransferase